MNVRNGIDSVNQLFPSRPTGTSSATQGETKPGEALKADQARLSAAASQASGSAAEPEVRIDRVAELQKAIQDGTYHVPASSVAEKVIATLIRPDK